MPATVGSKEVSNSYNDRFVTENSSAHKKGVMWIPGKPKGIVSPGACVGRPAFSQEPSRASPPLTLASYGWNGALYDVMEGRIEICSF